MMKLKTKAYELAGVPEVVVRDGAIYLSVQYFNAKREQRTQLYGPLSKTGAVQLAGHLDAVTDTAVPPCAASMGCLCAGHARGNAANEPCDTSEA